METIDKRETDRLIASDKVEGTNVYNHQGERLGTVRRFMVDKKSGQVEYAVLGFGGLFGLGEDYYPLPWQMLTYDVRHGGYVVNLDKDQLRDAPRYAGDNEPAYDRDYDEQVYGHYGLPSRY